MASIENIKLGIKGWAGDEDILIDELKHYDSIVSILSSFITDSGLTMDISEDMVMLSDGKWVIKKNI